MVICNCGAAPTATTSNGEPPPESEFDNWLFPSGALLGSITRVGTTPVGSVVTVDVAKVAVDTSESIFRPEDDVLGGWTVVVAGAAVVVASGVEVCVLVRRVVCAVDEELELVLALLLGHNALIPRSYWKTPMMDVSPTSTPSHPVLTAAPILARPCRQPELHIAPGVKSEGTHASILVL